jgi:non-canonical (house-cleaning) NTP pyrophosphatase
MFNPAEGWEFTSKGDGPALWSASWGHENDEYYRSVPTRPSEVVPIPSSITVLIASASGLKYQAIQQAFMEVKRSLESTISFGKNIDLQFITVAAKSNVNAQPIGWEETIKGANHRATNALSLAEPGTNPRVVIAIENGIINLVANGGDYYMDVGWVVLNDLDRKEQFVASSTSVSISASAVDVAHRRGFETTTVGDMLHECYPSIDSMDPHAGLLAGVTTRVSILQQAVVSCLGQWIYALNLRRPKYAK